MRLLRPSVFLAALAMLVLPTAMAGIGVATRPVASAEAAERPAPEADGAPPAEPDPFDAFLAAPFPIADGFDLPVRRARPGQVVKAIGHGRILVAEERPEPWGGVVVVEHVYYENHRREPLRSLHAHLGRLDVSPGDEVRRGQTLGTLAKTSAHSDGAPPHFELLSGETPADRPEEHETDLDARYRRARQHLEGRRELPVPQDEPRLVLVDAERYRMRMYEDGALAGEYEVGFGQERGRKRKRGDNRTPRGMYFVVDRHRGEMGGKWGAYYGGHWVKVNYPGPWDAEWGVENGLLTERRAAGITEAWKKRALTDQKTAVGSGIGFHGWIGPWDGTGGAHLSWGCIVMHNEDIAKVYDRLLEGTMVVVF